MQPIRDRIIHTNTPPAQSGSSSPRRFAAV